MTEKKRELETQTEHDGRGKRDSVHTDELMQPERQNRFRERFRWESLEQTLGRSPVYN